ncbi:hypothetical protein Tco_0422761 [Tanacetum coccineum]
MAIIIRSLDQGFGRAIKLALQIKHKLGFINGTCSRVTYLASAPLLLEQCDICKLQETYDKIDGYIVFNLLQKINSFKQGGLPVSEYYHKLNSLWREFDILTKLPDCTCASRIELVNHGKLLKLMQFLMGLDDIYQPKRSNILTREILPEVKYAFVIISMEESHRGIPPSTVKTDKLQVFPVVPFLIYSTKYMIDLVDVSDLKLIVGHPNGTLAKMTHVGSLRLNNDVILLNFLVVPEYTVSLLSVHKLIEDSKLSVGFDETKYYIQDLSKGKVLETGSEFSGLYLFDKEYNKFAISNNSPDSNTHIPQPRHDDLSTATPIGDNIEYEGNVGTSEQVPFFQNVFESQTEEASPGLRRKYYLELLHEFRLLACRPVLTHLPENIVLAHKESENDKFLHMHAPFKSHFHIALRLLKYLKLAPRNVTRRSISGYWVFVNGCLVSWKIKNQATLSKSSTKVEYRSMEAATSANPVMHEKTKHFDIDVHLVRKKVSSDTPPKEEEVLDADTKAFVEDMADNWEQRRKIGRTSKTKREQEEERLTKLKEDEESLYSLENVKMDYRVMKQRVYAGLWVKEIGKMGEAKLGGSVDDLDRFLDTACE